MIPENPFEFGQGGSSRHLTTVLCFWSFGLSQARSQVDLSNEYNVVHIGDNAPNLA